MSDSKYSSVYQIAVFILVVVFLLVIGNTINKCTKNINRNSRAESSLLVAMILTKKMDSEAHLAIAMHDIDINYTYNGRQLMHIALESKASSEIIELLIDKGVNIWDTPNKNDGTGKNIPDTVLINPCDQKWKINSERPWIGNIIAVSYDYDKFINMAVDKYKDKNSPIDDYGNRMMHYIVANNNIQTKYSFNKFQNYTKDDWKLNVLNHNNELPLWNATWNIIPVLLDHQSDVNNIDGNGNNYLMILAKKNTNVEINDNILGGITIGDKIQTIKRVISMIKDIDDTNNEGMTALYIAVKNSNKIMVEELINAGSDVTIRSKGLLPTDVTNNPTIKALLMEKNKEDIYFNGGNCLTCLANKSNVITQPCGHCVTCVECVKENDNCVLCGIHITKIQLLHGLIDNDEISINNDTISLEFGRVGPDRELVLPV
jgi:cation transport regulator ChaB